MVLLGPVVGRFTQEVLDPIILRVFNILWNAKEFPLPPDELQGQDMDIVYISPLARSQRESDIFSIQAFMQDVGLIAQAKPEVLDMVNGDKTVDIIAQIRGISPEIIYSEEQVKQVRQQRADQMAQMQQAQAIEQGAVVAKDAAAANKDLADSEAVTKGE
jgi:hypothetical protein